MTKYQAIITTIEQLWYQGIVYYDDANRIYYQNQVRDITWLKIELESKGIECAGGKRYLKDILYWMRKKEREKNEKMKDERQKMKSANER